MANGFPLGSPPPPPKLQAPGGVASDLASEAQGFVQTLLALREQAAQRAFRQAQLDLQRRQEDRLSEQGQAQIELQRGQQELQERLAQMQRDTNLQTTAMQQGTQQQLAEFQAETQRQIAELQAEAAQTRDARAFARENEQRIKELEINKLAGDAAELIDAGADPNDVVQFYQSNRDSVAPSLSESEIQAAVVRGRQILRQEEEGLADLLQGGLGEEEGEGAAGTTPTTPRSTFGGFEGSGQPAPEPEEEPEPSEPEPSEPQPAPEFDLEQVVASARERIESGRNSAEEVLAGVEQRFGRNAALAVAQELGLQGRVPGTGTSFLRGLLAPTTPSPNLAP